jgi:ABC-type lipoprotein export system ATPase subunit
LIIADEPTADLDQASADRVMNALRKATLNGAMLVCITHDTAVMNPSDRRLAFERAEL